MRFFKLFSLLLLLFTVQDTVVLGQSAQPYAVYMYSFTRYIKWPIESRTDFMLGVLGDSPVTPHLQQMATQKRVNGRAIRLITFDSPKDINQELDLLFLNDSWSGEEGTVERMINNQSHCLVITQEGKGNGHINFIQENGRLLFELNQAVLEESGMKISSELLALARVVVRNQSN